MVCRFTIVQMRSTMQRSTFETDVTAWMHILTFLSLGILFDLSQLWPQWGLCIYAKFSYHIYT
jgi:hypothetical protein